MKHAQAGRRTDDIYSSYEACFGYIYIYIAVMNHAQVDLISLLDTRHNTQNRYQRETLTDDPYNHYKIRAARAWWSEPLPECRSAARVWWSKPLPNLR